MDFHIGNDRISGRQGIQSHSRGKKAEQREPALGHTAGWQDQDKTKKTLLSATKSLLAGP